MGSNDDTTLPSADGRPARRLAGRMGRYVPLDKIGEGGMGVVYAAAQKQPEAGEREMRRALALVVAASGPDHPQAAVYTYDLREKQLGGEHPLIAETRRELEGLGK